MSKEELKMEIGGATQAPPRVSIGMPVYNGDKYVRDALDSLLAQTFSNFELIISDNGSTDKTSSICEEYAKRDARILYVKQSENKGAVTNFQFVLDRARGEFFMWAAYDDLWAKNYLRDALALLNEENIEFVFPTFSVRSIKLNIGKKFGGEIFRFIESTNRQQRVLQFLVLHHASHKCNIVYSLFKAEFLRCALKIQDISNDGVLGAVILGLGRGKILDGAMFRKRYPGLWPGALSSFFAWYYKNHSKEFELAKDVALNNFDVLFPEYINEIRVIFDHYQPFTYEKCYRICSIDSGQSRQGGNNGSK